ncbi:hypothetical protein [Sphingopyxis sp. PET50]|uniref:hypothetical protein n=1 Tax=Sphingopyxis sp. PET50 TaxID=2976533 RepID=UPI0028A7F852|nr:hypothetical protein [Sphingopyxis sp. PET50]
MRKTLFASTCLVALMATPAFAETTIGTATTAPVRTSTVKTGTPDDIKIAAAGSVTLTSGTAVTIDSNHKVVNDGTIQITNSDGATGISANASTVGGITNSATGKIIIDETYAPTDIDNDGDLDGPFAVGSNRVGIATQGAFTGNIVNSGAITVEGNDSAGIRLGGPLTGNFTNDGTISVLGDRALGVGLQDVTGNVRLAGTITATGLDATAARLSGNITGALVVQGNLTATGYRFTSPPADPSKLDADDLLNGGPALSIEGDVTGGIVLAVPPKDSSSTDNDEDKDGIEDAKEGSAVVRSFGSAPAMRIGAANRDVTIGPVAGTGTNFGVIVDGTILGNGLYTGKDATAVQIGGLGGNVTVAGGLAIGSSGNVTAISNGASATAIRIGAGATLPEIRNAGKIEASGGKDATAITTGILVEAGSNVGMIRNSGTIGAKAAGNDGTARGIVDLSGNVDLVENSGTISATGALATSGRNIAIDLSANGGGATVKQTAVASGVAAPAIVGDVRFGAGNDVFDIADGSVKGNSFFGAEQQQPRPLGRRDLRRQCDLRRRQRQHDAGGHVEIHRPCRFRRRHRYADHRRDVGLLGPSRQRPGPVGRGQRRHLRCRRRGDHFLARRHRQGRARRHPRRRQQRHRDPGHRQRQLRRRLETRTAPHQPRQCRGPAYRADRGHADRCEQPDDQFDAAALPLQGHADLERDPADRRCVAQECHRARPQPLRGQRLRRGDRRAGGRRGYRAGVPRHHRRRAVQEPARPDAARA